MKKSRIQTLWIIFLSGCFTAYTCLLPICKSIFGKIDRKWSDQVISNWINKLLNLANVKCTIINPHNVKPKTGQATIIMCNHSSMYDIPLSYKAFPEHSIRMLAKKELSRVPLLGRAMKAAEFPFIDRKRRNQAMKDLEYAKSLMESGITLWLAPEGTRSRDGKLAAFKKGGFITAINAKATIIPIGIRGAYDILPPDTLNIHKNQNTEIHIGQPIDASEYSLENKDELINIVYQEMKQLTGESKARSSNDYHESNAL